LLVLNSVQGTRLCLNFSVLFTRVDVVWSEAEKFLK